MAEQHEPDVQLQREYYSRTAHAYDNSHVNDTGEHHFALTLMLGALQFLEAGSVLDVGSGTGRVVNYLNRQRPELRVVGIEPVEALREVGYRNGLSRGDLIDGDANKLPFADGEFDLVCEFGVLHHIKEPAIAVGEMLRVAKKAIFISDSNNFGQGSFLFRTIKQALNACGLWKAADRVKTRGRGYTFTEGDGVAYSYSVFQNHRQISEKCGTVHVMNSDGSGINPYRTASHVVLLGLKDCVYGAEKTGAGERGTP